MAFQNRYPGRCSNRSCPNGQNVYDGVPAGKGWTTKDASGYRTWCKDCCPERGEATPAAGPRELRADGRVIIGYEPANMPLLRSLPGYRNTKNGNGSWEMSCSVAPADLPRVLEIADKIGLKVAPALRDACKPTEEAVAASYDSRLYPFQVKGVDHLARRPKAFLSDEMGLGKTVQALASRKQDGSEAVLVVCPASLKYNWRNEAKKWAPAYKVAVLAGKTGFRLPVRGEILIVNYDILPEYLSSGTCILLGEGKSGRWANLPEANNGERLLEESGKVYLVAVDYFCPECEGSSCKTCKFKGDNKKPTPFEVSNDSQTVLMDGSLSSVTVIVDEVQLAKSYKTLRAKRLTKICDGASKVIAMTGTPLMNRPFDLWGVLCSTGMAREVFGSFGTFLRLFGAEKDQWGGYTFQQPGPEVAERLRRVMLRRLRKDVLPDLPDKTYSEIECNGIPAKLAKRMDELEAEWGSWLDADELPPFEEFSAIRAALAESRVPAMLEHVEAYEESETPLVVFSAYRAPIDALNGREGWATITGDTPVARRQEIVDAFQGGKLKGVALTIAAGGVGLTLTRAAHVLFVDLDWVPANNSQAEDRLCRIGQTADKIQVIRMVSDHPLDKHVQRLLVQKINMARAAIDAEAKALVPQVPDNKGEGETEEAFQARMQRKAAAEEATAKARQEANAARVKAEAKGRVARIRDREMAKKAKELLPLTLERVAAVKGAFARMLADDADQAELKNGIGFNRPDSAVAHWVLDAGLDSDGGVELAYAMLTRYARQLKGDYPILFKG